MNNIDDFSRRELDRKIKHDGKVFKLVAVLFVFSLVVITLILMNMSLKQNDEFLETAEETTGEEVNIYDVESGEEADKE